MKLLAVDTASVAVSVAIADENQLICELFLHNGLTHSQTIMPLVDQALSLSGLSLSSIDKLAVTTGPGSFTGLRIGLGTVKGLALGADLPVVGIGTLPVLAWNGEAFSGALCPIMDARREQVYNALYKSDRKKLTTITPPRAVAIDTLISEVHEPTLFMGDGVPVYRAAIEEALGSLARFLPPDKQMTRAASLAELAKDEEAVDPALITPLYLRLSQAEREYNEKHRKDDKT